MAVSRSEADLEKAVSSDAPGPRGERTVERTLAISSTDERGTVATPAAPRDDGREWTEITPGTLVSEFRVKRKIGEGGMGSVYGAVHQLIGKRAAIKVIRASLGASASAADRFLREARAVNEIRHPNVVDTFAFGSLPDGRCYLIMEWLEGESLATRLRRSALPLAESLSILDQIASALEATHAQSIVHRDLKPANVFLVSHPSSPSRPDAPMVKLLDFGVAKLARERNVAPHEESSDHSGIATMVGTPRYLPPEQARGERADAPADIYSLGAVAFEMLVGRAPFEGGTPVDLVAKHILEAPPRPSSLKKGIPPALDALILRMLAKQPGDRPTLAEIRDVLRGVRPNPNGRTRPRGPLVLGILVASIALVAVAARERGWFPRRPSTPSVSIDPPTTVDPAPPPAVANSSNEHAVVVPTALANDAPPPVPQRGASKTATPRAPIPTTPHPSREREADWLGKQR